MGLGCLRGLFCLRGLVCLRGFMYGCIGVCVNGGFDVWGLLFLGVAWRISCWIFARAVCGIHKSQN
jgi:hypothetical protein